jgi:hypothetical protein
MQLTYDELAALLQGARYDGRKKNIYAICPQCGHDEFGISLSKFHRFGCFRKKDCGFNGNIFTLLKALGKRPSDVVKGYEPKAILENKIAVEDRQLELDQPTIEMPMGWKRIYHSDYLELRGFTKDDYERFEVGMTKADPRFMGWTIFTVRQFGDIKGYVARNPKSKEELKRINVHRKKQGLKQELRYENSSSDFSKLLGGLEELTDNTHTAILVEGLFDKHNTDKKLDLPSQEEVKCLCTFKCGVSDEQIFLLQQAGVTTIILLYDPDVIKEIKKAAWKLEDYFNVYVAFNDAGLDPGDMSAEDFDRVLADIKSPSQFETSRLFVPELRKK